MLLTKKVKSAHKMTRFLDQCREGRFKVELSCKLTRLEKSYPLLGIQMQQRLQLVNGPLDGPNSYCRLAARNPKGLLIISQQFSPTNSDNMSRHYRQNLFAPVLLISQRKYQVHFNSLPSKIQTRAVQIFTINIYRLVIHSKANLLCHSSIEFKVAWSRLGRFSQGHSSLIAFSISWSSIDAGTWCILKSSADHSNIYTTQPHSPCKWSRKTE